MKDFLVVSKCSEKELPVPSEWRQTFSRIVEAFRTGDFKIEKGIPSVQPISNEDAKRIADNIDSYGSRLDRLPEETWDTSVCRWMDGYWDVLVDLFTVQEGLSDLVLFTRVYENGSSYEFQIQSVNVP